MSTFFRIQPRILAIGLACVLLPTGCQKAADRMTEDAIERASDGQVKIERDGDKVVLKTADGQVTMQGGDALPLPAAFPKDVYLPGDYAVNSVMDLEGVSMVSLRAPGKVPGLFADARESMVAQGWKETMAMQHSVESAMLAFEKEQRAATLSFSDDGDAGVAVGVQLRDGERQ